jgi:hypothetical protein
MECSVRNPLPDPQALVMLFAGSVGMALNKNRHPNPQAFGLVALPAVDLYFDEWKM